MDGHSKSREKRRPQNTVAYDEDLADRIRELVADEAGVSGKKMFGGLAFLISGKMAVAASGGGGMTVRVDPAMSDALVARTSARLEDVPRRNELARWVELGTTYARSLPAKR